MGFSWSQLNGTFTLSKGKSEFHYYFFANLTVLPEFLCMHTNILRAGVKKMGPDCSVVPTDSSRGSKQKLKQEIQSEYDEKLFSCKSLWETNVMVNGLDIVMKDFLHNMAKLYQEP